MIDRSAGSSADPLVSRVPPHSLEAEMAVLGSVLQQGEVMGNLVPILEPGHFYRRIHGTIYEVMLGLYDRGEPVDAILVLRECERAGVLGVDEARDLLSTLYDAVASSASAEYYAGIVREKAMARELIAATTEIQQAAWSETGRGDELMEMAEARIFELGEKSGIGEVQGVRGLLNQTFEELEKGDGQRAGIETGFYEFDDYTTGLRGGELIIVAARPSMGKTSFALNVAMNAAVRSGKKVAIFSLEMTAQNIVRNMICATARFNGQHMRKGRFLTGEQIGQLAEAAGPLFEAGLFIDDTPSLSPTLLRAKARRLKQREGLDLIVIDYLQLMESGTAKRGIDNRQQEISYISRSLKGLARELDVPVIALSQLNRDAEKREGNKPKLSDLRESGAIEQDADVICLLFRPHYYTRDESQKNLAEVIIAKQRNGPTGTVRLHFFPDWMLFGNPSVQSL